MNPDFLEKLQQITAALRGGLIFNPLDELQKRSTQYGEGVGLQLEKNAAQAGYAKSHPESARAQTEALANTAMMALQMGKPELASEDVAAIKSPTGKIYRGPTHTEAIMAAQKDKQLPSYAHPDFNSLFSKFKEGFMTAEDKFVNRAQAYKLVKPTLSKPVQAQIETRAQQSRGVPGMTTEDVNGKLYANRGTTADEPITGDEFDKIVEKYRKEKGKTAALDSVAVRFGPKRTTIGPNDPIPPFWGTRLHDALTKNGGFTIDPQTGADLTSGYSVGGGEKSGVLLKKPLADLKPTELQDFLNANRSKLQPGQAWGGWVDKGHVYVEPADQVADVNEAQRLGNERGEQAIWDHANKAEIPLKLSKANGAVLQAKEIERLVNKWQTVWSDYDKTGKEVRDFPNERRSMLATALRQHDIERPNGAQPEKIAQIEDMANEAFRSPQFKKWLYAGQGTGNWYDTRKTQAQAIDALGAHLGPKAFNELIDHMAASTAMSRPENNLRRASWWRALNLQGMLNPEELRSSTLAAPEGMGHIAQRAHHFAVADLVQNGKLNTLGNPKPASFAENLKMNWRPVTFDTRMSNALLSTEPKATLGLAGVKSDATPRKWAYAPIERAAQSAAAEAAQRGDLGDLPPGADPTAAWQAQVWGGIGRADKTHMMSVNNPSFHEILDRLLKRSAALWNVTPGKANELFWKGQPLDLPLDASLLNGPARLRKK